MTASTGTAEAVTGTRRALRAACLAVAVVGAWWVLAVAVGGTAHAADQQGPLGRVTERAGLDDPVGDVVRRLAPAPAPGPAPAPLVRQASRVLDATPVVRTVVERVARPAQRVVAQVTPVAAPDAAPAPSPAAPTPGRGAATRPVPAATGVDAARPARADRPVHADQPTRTPLARTAADLAGALPSTLDRTLANVGARLGLGGLGLPAVADLAEPVTSPVVGLVDRVALSIHAAAGPVLQPVLRPVVDLVPPVVGSVPPGRALVRPATTGTDLAGRSAQRIPTAAADRPAPGPGTGTGAADRSSTASLLMTGVLTDTAANGPAAVGPDTTHGRSAAGEDRHELPGAQPAPSQAGSGGAPGPLAPTTGHRAGTPALGRGTTTPDAASLLRGRPAPEPGSSPG